jgi:hypothetical protein
VRFGLALFGLSRWIAMGVLCACLQPEEAAAEVDSRWNCSCDGSRQGRALEPATSSSQAPGGASSEARRLRYGDAWGRSRLRFVLIGSGI